MNWFKGEISEAVATSKTKNAIFVVYVEGKDEKSSEITALIDKDEISTKLGGDNFVAIKIESESVPYQQFSQIYKQVPVPSIYFIGKQGVPLEIITEAKDAKTFTDKLNSILQKGGITPVAKLSQDFINNEQSPPVPPNVVCENDVCTIKKEDKPSTSQEAPQPQSTENKKELSAEEKIEKAKQLVEKKREEKRREEEEKERQKEIERRKMGQNAQQLKRWQDDQELKQVLEEREKEKRAGQAARERVLAQIAQDKAERASKFSNSPPQNPQVVPQGPPQVAPRPATSNTARLQFRMPDGRTATNDFSSSETLESVHAHIRAHLSLPFSHYTLSTTFPRREFTDNDKSQTLSDLGLVPTAVILILPINRGGTVATNPAGGFTGFLWSILTPIFTLLGYLKTFVFGSAPNPNPNPNTDSNKRAADSTSEARMQPKVRRSGETTVIKRQGNIHRLSNKNDSDDENNTWNGNSTQQM